MTDEELAKIEASIDRSQKWWDSLSDEEKQKETESADDTRLWEDWTDCDPIANVQSQPSKSRSVRK